MDIIYRGKSHHVYGSAKGGYFKGEKKTKINVSHNHTILDSRVSDECIGFIIMRVRVVGFCVCDISIGINTNGLILNFEDVSW